MLLDGKARLDRIQGGIDVHFRSIHIELLAPDQTRLLALIDNGLEEATKQLHTIAAANAREARMIGEWLIQVVA